MVWNYKIESKQLRVLSPPGKGVVKIKFLALTSTQRPPQLKKQEATSKAAAVSAQNCGKSKTSAGSRKAKCRTVLQRRHAASKTQGFFSKTIKPFFLCTKVTGGGDGFIAEPKAHLHGNMLYSFLAVAVVDTYSDGSFYSEGGERRRVQKQIVKVVVAVDIHLVLFSTGSLRSVLCYFFQDS